MVMISVAEIQSQRMPKAIVSVQMGAEEYLAAHIVVIQQHPSCCGNCTIATTCAPRHRHRGAL